MPIIPLRKEQIELILQKLLLEEKVAMSMKNGQPIYTLTDKGNADAIQSMIDLGIVKNYKEWA